MFDLPNDDQTQNSAWLTRQRRSRVDEGFPEARLSEVVDEQDIQYMTRNTHLV